LNAGLAFLSMARAKRLNEVAYLYVKAVRQDRRMDYFTADCTMYQLVGDDLVPAVLQYVPELDGMLRAYSPAGGAASASGHVVKERLDPAGFPGIERPRRAVLDTGQAPVALFVHLEIDHCSLSGLR